MTNFETKPNNETGTARRARFALLAQSSRIPAHCVAAHSERRNESKKLRHSSFVICRFPIALALAILFAPTVTSAADKVTYVDHVQPILREHCFACHNQDDATASLALDSFDGVAAGGAGGEVVAAGDPDGSRLWKLVTHQEEPKMPPGDKLPEAQLDVIRAWIEGGLLENQGSKPVKRKKPAIAKIDADKLGKPVGEPAMPKQLLHESVLWTPNAGPVEALATSPWAPLAAIGWQRQISFYHTATHELLGIVPYVDGVPKIVRFSRDGSLVLVAGGRHSVAGSAALFDVKTGARLATLGDELDIVLAADISPDLALVAIGGPKKKVRVYRVADGELAYQIAKHTEWITALGFSPDGRLLATADRNGGALVWQADAGHERADLRGHKATITSLDWRADSAMLATASEDGTVRLWNPAGKEIKAVTAHQGGVLSVRFAQDGNWVTTGRDQMVKAWKPDGGALADLGKLPGMTLAAAFTHDGKHVLASDYTGEVRVIDVASKKSVTTLQPNPPLLAERFAAAENSVQEFQLQIEASEKQTKLQIAELEQAKAAHEAHERKLASAETSLAEKRELYDEAAQFLEEHRQKLAETLPALQQAANDEAEAKAQLERALAQSSETTDNTESSESTEEKESKADSNSEKIVELKKKVELAQAGWKSTEQQADQAYQKLETAKDGEQAALVAVQSAETVLAQVTNETAGLLDLAKLSTQHEQANAKLATAQQQLKQAEQVKARIAAQQVRFQQAAARFASQLEKRQTEQQELAKQTGRLEAEHQQAAEQLSSHNSQLNEVAQQVKALQSKLAELQTGEAKLKEHEATLAKQLGDVQTAVSQSQQQAEMIEQSRRDFSAAEELRKKYSADQ